MTAVNHENTRVFFRASVIDPTPEKRNCSNVGLQASHTMFAFTGPRSALLRHSFQCFSYCFVKFHTFHIVEKLGLLTTKMLLFVLCTISTRVP